MRESLMIHSFVTASRTAKSCYRGVSELIHIGAPEAEVEALFDELRTIRGAHRVEVRWNPGDVVNGEYVDSPWRGVYFRGTETAQRLAARVLDDFDALIEPDRNADHDHVACIVKARKLGVPSEWAHMPETYLSM